MAPPICDQSTRDSKSLRSGMPKPVQLSSKLDGERPAPSCNTRASDREKGQASRYRATLTSGSLKVPRWEHQSFPPKWLFVMFGNLLLWVKDVRRLSHSVSAEYLVEVELYMTSRSPLPIDEYGDAYWRPEHPNQKFPHCVISGDSDVVEVLGRFYRDAYHLVGQDMDATLAIST